MIEAAIWFAAGFGFALALHALTGWLAGRRLPHIDLDFYTVPSVDADIALGHTGAPPIPQLDYEALGTEAHIAQSDIEAAHIEALAYGQSHIGPSHMVDEAHEAQAHGAQSHIGQSPIARALANERMRRKGG